MPNCPRNKPLIAVSMGDPLGIGPEIIEKALRSPKVQRACDCVILGNSKFFRNKNLPIIEIPCGGMPSGHKPGKEGGLLSFKAVEAAVKLAKSGAVDAVVTAPVSKQSWQSAGIPYMGHTEYLKKEDNCPDAVMMFESGNLRAALITEHQPIKKLHIPSVKIISVCRHIQNFLKDKGYKTPSIAVCGLNPHSGDNGKIGNEEKTIIAPAIKKSKLKNVFGPYPADTAWLRHIEGKYQAIVCMYHDQALMPLKIAAKEPIVHITYGLSFIRTSPAHGTAFDIAGKGIADAGSMTAAILSAAGNFFPNRTQRKTHRG